MNLIKNSILRGFKKCSCCGCRILKQSYPKPRIRNKVKLCQECTFWKNIINNRPEDYYIVGERCMQIGEWVEEANHTMILGSGGTPRYFVRSDFSVFKSNDVWIIGTIPERFRDILKPELEEIKGTMYAKIKRFPHRCKAKACFDRYHCFRYDKLKEVNPYNNIPYDWEPGKENCRYFLNRNERIIDESNIKRKIKNKLK